MANFNTRFTWDALRSVPFATIAGTAEYIGIGDAIDVPAVQITLQNLTDARLMFTMNTSQDGIRILPSGFHLIDIASLKSGAGAGRLPANIRFYVKREEVPTSGTVDLTVSYFE